MSGLCWKLGPNTTALPKKAVESTQDPLLGLLSDGALLLLIGSFWPWEVHVNLVVFHLEPKLCRKRQLLLV